MTTVTANTAKSRYDKWSSDREPFLRRAREASELTIPFLIPPEGHNGTDDFATPWQGIGAWGVNSLKSKLMSALFPANAPFFRYQISNAALAQMGAAPEMKGKIEEKLGERERSIKEEIEGTHIRVGLNEAVRHLLVSGNGLIFLPPKGGIRIFRLDRYVVKRDAAGNVLDIITKENISPLLLPENIREVIAKNDASDAEGKSDTNDVEIYTHIKRKKTHWAVYQEIKGMVIESTRGSYPLDKTPWIPIRFTRIDGEDYGRGYVEEYLGDLKSLEGLSQSIVEGSAAAAKVLFLVNPNGTTDAKKLDQARSGSILEGNAADVSTLQLDKFSDFRVAGETINNIQERLANAFMMNSAVQRDAERVTAEEIRFMASELEATLGGVYSILSLELQVPLVAYTEFRMERENRLVSLPKDTVKPVIVTGMEALGRGNDLTKLTTFTNALTNALGPEGIRDEINRGELATRLATSLGIDAAGLIKTEEQKAAEAQQQQMAQLAAQAAGPATQAAGRVVEKGLDNG